MVWTAENPVTVHTATKKTEYDKLWNNADFLYTFLNDCSLTDHGVLVGSGTSPITALTAMTDGQLVIGSTGNDPSLATLTPAQIINVTNAAGSITVGLKDYGCHVSLSDDQNISATTETKIEFDTELYDPQTEFASYKYTASTAGKYFISLCVHWEASADTKVHIAYIKVNGSAVTQSAKHGSNTNPISTDVAMIIDLDANDYVEGYVYHDVAGGVDVDGSASLTKLTIQRLI